MDIALILLKFALGFALLFYLLVPLAIYGMLRLYIKDTLNDIDVSDITDTDLAHFQRVEDALESEGFVCVGHITTEGMSKDSTIIFRMLVHPEARTACLASAIHLHAAAAGDTANRVRHGMEFSTDYQSGTQYNTGTSMDAYTLDLGPNKTVIVLPGALDPVEQYRCHLFFLNEQQAVGEREAIPLDKTPARLLLDEIADHMDEKARRGYWRVDGQGVCRPTIKGAYLLTWAQLWPWKGIRHASKRREAAALMRRAGIGMRRQGRIDAAV